MMKNSKTTYGIKRMNGKTTRILTNTKEFVAPMHVGINALTPRTFKTQSGAEKVARRNRGSEVFSITDIMNY